LIKTDEADETPNQSIVLMVLPVSMVMAVVVIIGKHSRILV
jgi:hypothetical protein